MQIDAQEYLDMAEASSKLVFFDIEATGLKGNYNSVLCVSFKPYGKKPYTFAVEQVGNDQKVLRLAKEELEKYHSWCSYYGKGFDIPMLNTRLLKWRQEPIDRRHHIDMYYVGKSHTLLSPRSMAAVAGFLGTPEQKQSVNPEVWSEMPFNLKKHMPTMISRCESDCAVLEDVYKRTRHLIRNIELQR
jgi:DNA polymerase elongation subunit (family B)